MGNFSSRGQVVHVIFRSYLTEDGPDKTKICSFSSTLRDLRIILRILLPRPAPVPPLRVGPLRDAHPPGRHQPPPRDRQVLTLLHHHRGADIS